MRFKKSKKNASTLLACAMICSNVTVPQMNTYATEVPEMGGQVATIPSRVTTSQTLDIVAKEGQSEKVMYLDGAQLADGSLTATTVVGDFTIVAAAGASVDIEANAKTADDGTSYTKRIKLGGAGNFSKRSIHFSTTGKATVEVYAMSSTGSVDRSLELYQSDETNAIGSVVAYGANLVKGTIEIAEAGDYYLASPASGVNVYAVKVTVGGSTEEVDRPSWDSVAAPVITSVDYKSGDSNVVEIKFDLETSDAGADKATVEVRDSAGEVVDSILVGKTADVQKVAEFEPTSSDTYTFTVNAARNGEETVKPSNPESFSYVLPLKAPVIGGATNKGGGDVLLKWAAAKEAESYRVEYKTATTEYTEATTTPDLEASITGLNLDKEYTFRVTALRGGDATSSAEYLFTVRDRIEREWAFTYFGQSSNKDLNTVEVVDRDNLTLKLNSCTLNPDGTTNKKGGKFTKFHDGISYYYTEIDAAKENFELTATFTLDYINPTPDGQEGFGIIAMDNLGEHGVSSVNHYTNSAAVIATKFDKVENGTTTALKDTLGARFTSGITPEVLTGGDSAVSKYGKGVATAFSYDVDDLVKQGESYTLTLKKTNTGYHAIINNDETTEQIMYDPNKLLQLDSDKVYVGFAAARGCNVTVSDISMTITDPATDAPAIPEPEQTMPVSTKIDSPTSSAVSDYNFVFTANADGKITIKDAANTVLVDSEAVVAGKDYSKVLQLAAGKNDYTVSFLPDADYLTPDGLKLESYDEVVLNHSVTLKGYEDTVIYVAPNGSASGLGTTDSPVDIYTATQYVKPGQTISLAGGTYNMTAPLTIARGINGTEASKITLKSEDGTRAVLNFKNAGGGMQLWGNYWHVYGIDVCETPGNVKGLQVAGSNNIIELVNTYRNGDTGLQISGTGAEGFDKWPANNLILNCTSYDNCDPGMNNADGFAAKITTGNGNIFRGCIAHNNLDDGWDLFAKIESGPIGAVIIEDSIAYNNGTLTTGVGKGDGNGFKLGGDGIAVAHTLRNSISFNNNTDGITSNSNPAAVLENNTAYGNKGTNIALYGKGTGDRLFVAKNNISMAGGSSDRYSEMPSLASENNYFFNGTKSMNSVGAELKADIFKATDLTIKPERHEDGSISMKGLLELNDKAPAGIGAVLDVTTGEETPSEPGIINPVMPRSWEFGKGEFAAETIQGKEVTIQDVIIDATNGKFNAVGRANAQINPGTKVKIPVNGPCEITFKHGYDSGEITFTDEAGNVITHKYNASGWSTETVTLDAATKGYVTMEWKADSKFYLESLTMKPMATEMTWNMGDAEFTAEKIEGSKKVIQDIIIDATKGKFNAVNRKNAQINPGTILKVPVNGASTITFKHGYDAGILKITDEAGNVIRHTYNAPDWITEQIAYEGSTVGYLTFEWEQGSNFYLETLSMKPAASGPVTLTVGPNSTYSTVQSALDAITYAPTEQSRVTIAIEPGVYVEEVKVDKPYITFINADPTKEVKITYDKASGHDSDSSKNFGTQDTASVTIKATAKGFEAYNIIFENSYNLGQESLGDDPNARKQTQAVAVVTFADRIVFDNCKFIGRQDTLYLKGASIGQMTPGVNEARVYLKDCYVEGTVDFIFGDSTAVFDNCELRMAYYTNGGHYTAANTNLESLGYVFNNCKLTIDEAYKPYIDSATGKFKLDEKGKPVKNIDLGRPWQADHTYPYFGSQTVFNNCKMDPAIAATGWSVWDTNTVTNKVRYMEYNSMDLQGNLVDLSSRLDWIRILKADQAAAYNTVNVLWGSDGWNPSKGQAITSVEVADITLDQYKVELPQGEKITLKAEVLPVQASNKAYTWRSSDKSVATVDANGNVTAVGVGNAQITATTAENNCEVSADVKVLVARTAVPTVKEIKIEAKETILPGDTLKGIYSYELEADNAKDKAKVQWYVVDPKTGDEILVQEGSEDFDREYKVTSGDIGYQIKFAVIPETTTTYGDCGTIVKSEASTVISKPNYEVPKLYVREPFSSFLDKYQDVAQITEVSESEWIGTNVAKGGITDRSGLTLLHNGDKVSTGKMAWKVVDTSGKATDNAEYNGNATVAANIEYQNDASILVYNAKETWTNYVANARVRFSPAATGFSAASYWDMYICYNPETNTGYKTRVARGGNTSSAVITLYKVVDGVETVLAVDNTTLANKLKQNAGEENPFFRVEMTNKFGEITSKVYFEGSDETAVTLTYKDKAPLAGTVAFENFGKAGCPLIDMLTVEEIIKTNSGGGNGSGGGNESGGNNESSNSSGGGGSTTTPVKTILEQIKADLAAGKLPSVGLDKNNVVELVEQSIQILVDNNKGLNIKVNNLIQMVFPVETLKEQGKAKVQIKAAAPKTDIANKILEALKENDQLKVINNKDLTFVLEMTATEKVTRFNEPIQIVFNVSKQTIKDTSKLTAVRYQEQSDGTLKAVKIGGTYDVKTGEFKFLTDEPGIYGLVEAETLAKLSLSIGDKAASVNGKTVVNDVAPEIVEGRVMLPVRFIAESLGAKVGFKKGYVTLTINEQIISFKVGEELEGYNVTPFIKEGRTYISARWVAETLGANVLWVPSTKAVEIVK